MKKLMKKKNNKGFSLVELIVVVLILGILAVALAPQVMKWVDTAKTNSDKNNARSIESSVSTAMADAQASGWTLPVDGSGVKQAVSFTLNTTDLGTLKTNHLKLYNAVVEVLKLDDTDATTLEKSLPKTQADGYFSVTISTTFQVTVTY